MDKAHGAAGDLPTPLERTEDFYTALVRWYGDGKDKEARAASKLLMVALDQLHRHAGANWQGTVYEYIHILASDPARFQQMLNAQRGRRKRGDPNDAADSETR